MKNLTINTNQELKKFVLENRKNITEINGVKFNPIYPMISVTNKHASYYDVELQGEKFLLPPFQITCND